MTSQHQDWMHEAFRDHGLHGHAATREGEFGLRTGRRRDPADPWFVVALLALTGVSAYCAFAPWVDAEGIQTAGISHGRGLSWLGLILSLSLGAVLLVGVVRTNTVLRTVVVTLFVALTLETVTCSLNLFAFQPRSYPFSPGWGLLLDVAVSACGAIVAAWWWVRASRALATRAVAAGTPRVPLAGAPTASH
jgi:hypothetical protein